MFLPVVTHRMLGPFQSDYHSWFNDCGFMLLIRHVTSNGKVVDLPCPVKPPMELTTSCGPIHFLETV
jgi:hypothetical protein